MTNYAKFDIIHPVSYTHLDVYKRQLQEAQKNNRFLTVVSLITSENEHSIYLHKQFGFEFGGRIKNVGFKFDRLLGVDIYYKNFQ